MNQNTFTALFVSVIILAVIVLAIGKFMETNGGLNNAPNGSAQNALFPTASGDALGLAGAQSAFQQAGQGALPNQAGQQQKQIKQYKNFPGVLQPDQLKDKKAVIQTDKGIIEIALFSDVPKTASNFMILTSEKFYDGLTFHRVEPGFVIQGGDPFGNGKGGPGYVFEDEPVTRKYEKGTVAMANSGPNTNGSQFFIVLGDNVQLEPKYTIFGKVTKGIDVAQQIAVGDVMRSVTLAQADPTPAPTASPSPSPSGSASPSPSPSASKGGP